MSVTFTNSAAFGLVALFVIVMVAVLMSPTLTGEGYEGTTEPAIPAHADDDAASAHSAIANPRRTA